MNPTYQTLSDTRKTLDNLDRLLNEFRKKNAELDTLIKKAKLNDKNIFH